MAQWTEITPHEGSIYTEIHSLDLGDNFIISIYKGHNKRWYKKVPNLWGNEITVLPKTSDNDDVADREHAKRIIISWIENYIESEVFRLNTMSTKLFNHILENVKL